MRIIYVSLTIVFFICYRLDGLKFREFDVPETPSQYGSASPRESTSMFIILHLIEGACSIELLSLQGPTRRLPKKLRFKRSMNKRTTQLGCLDIPEKGGL